MRGEPRQESREASVESRGGARLAGAPLSWRQVLANDPSLADTLERAWQIRQAGFPPEISFSRPGSTKPVSLTGSACALNCAHCGGHYLSHMSGLEEVLARAEAHGHAPGSGSDSGSGPGGPTAPTSYLISGGCVAATGQVPFMDHLRQLRRLKAHGRLNFHVGLVGETEAAALAGLADTVSFDLVGDNDTIREILYLDRTAEDYRSSLMTLSRHVPVVPHILVGLHRGQLRGEQQALEMAAEAGCKSLVFIVFIPTRGTELAGCQPPDPAAVASLLAYARKRLPQVSLGLGCMRPPGSYRSVLDPLAVRAGLQSIVMPARAAVEQAEAAGLRISYTTECCVL